MTATEPSTTSAEALVQDRIEQLLAAGDAATADPVAFRGRQ